MINRLTAAFLLASASFVPAHADPVTGLLSVGGSATYDTSSITFTGLGNVFGISTGTLVTVPLCNGCVTFPVNPFVYGQNFVSGLPIFDVISQNIEVRLDVTSIDAGSGIDQFGDLLLRGTGTLSQSGYTPSDATFALSSQFGQDTASVSFSNSARTTAATPEPASLLLLCTGLVGGAMMLRRKASFASHPFAANAH